MNAEVKEVLVGVIPGKDGNGEIVGRPIMFAGPNPFIPKGIYTPDNPPPGWPWETFLEKAIRHNGHGVYVVYKGDKPSPFHAVLNESLAADKKTMAEQERIRKAMVGGRPREPEPKAEGGDK